MATLKISELSVGDWVRYEDNIYKLYAIEGCGLLRGVWEDSENIAHIAKNIDYFNPIPITAEILEKNGLCVVEQDADFCEYELFGSKNFSLFHTKGTLRYRLETPQASVVCWFVHELQHALRLAGVDKEINL